MSWFAINTGLTNTVVHALTIDPFTPNVLFAGTFGGVFRTEDRGGDWDPANSGFTACCVSDLGIDHNTFIHYAVTTDGGVFRSFDLGGTWSLANNGLTTTNVRALAIDHALYRDRWQRCVQERQWRRQLVLYQLRPHATKIFLTWSLTR